jgi:hypothetical protein
MLVADKIAAVFRAQAQPAANPVPARARSRKKRDPPPPAFVTPLTMRYVVPPEVPIVLWDSAVRGAVGPDENLETFAARLGAPPWAIASINNIGEELPAAGTQLLVPRNAGDAR